MKRLLVTVLSMEAVVVLLAIVPAKQLGHASGGMAAAVCGAIAVVALALCGYVGRGRGALYAGSVFQALVIASGVLLPAMYILGAIFAALWFTGIWLGRKWERPTPRRASRVFAGQSLIAELSGACHSPVTPASVTFRHAAQKMAASNPPLIGAAHERHAHEAWEASRPQPRILGSAMSSPGICPPVCRVPGTVPRCPGSRLRCRDGAASDHWLTG